MNKRRDVVALIARAIDQAQDAWKVANGGDSASCIDMPTEDLARATLDLLHAEGVSFRFATPRAA